MTTRAHTLERPAMTLALRDGEHAIIADILLDLGQTDLVGTLVFDGESLRLITPIGTRLILGHRNYMVSADDTVRAEEGTILIEELGFARKLPAALVALGFFQEVARHRGLGTWDADVVQLRVGVPA